MSSKTKAVAAGLIIGLGLGSLAFPWIAARLNNRQQRVLEASVDRDGSTDQVMMDEATGFNYPDICPVHHEKLISGKPGFVDGMGRPAGYAGTCW